MQYSANATTVILRFQYHLCRKTADQAAKLKDVARDILASRHNP